MTFPRIEPLGDGALLLRLGDAVDDNLNARVHAVAATLRDARIPEIVDIVPTYAALAVYLTPMSEARWAWVEEHVLACAHRPQPQQGKARWVEIPVRYGGEEGPDLREVAQQAGISPEEVVHRHTASLYRVHFVGFSPGFPYLGGMDPTLATPRRSTPRSRVPAGSVGIGGEQTGVYPQDSPGGWNLIGRTNLRLFDPDADPPCLLLPGDRVRFVEAP